MAEGHVYRQPEGAVGAELAALERAGMAFAGKRILDAGCGGGGHSLALARAGAARVLGLDAEPGNIALARAGAAHPALEFAVADLERWESPEPFDLVFARGSLYYCRDLGFMLDRVAAWLRPGGEVYLTLTPDAPLPRALNGFKRLAAALPGPLRAPLRLAAALAAFALSGRYGAEQWRGMWAKASTIFHPQRFLLSPRAAEGLLRAHGFEPRRRFEVSGHPVLGSDYGLWAVRVDGPGRGEGKGGAA